MSRTEFDEFIISLLLGLWGRRLASWDDYESIPMSYAVGQLAQLAFEKISAGPDAICLTD